MAILFQDGFDLYGVISDFSFTYVAYSNFTYSKTTGRFGKGAATGTTYGGVSLITPTLPATQTIILSFAFKIPSGGQTSTDNFLTFSNASGVVFALRGLIGTNTCQCVRGTTVLASFDFGTRAVWHWVSIKLKVSNTVGTLDIQYDGTSVVSISGQDTNNTAGADDVTSIKFSALFQIDIVWDDIIICDTTGAAPFNDLLADRRIDTILPNAAGDSSGFTASPAVANYLNVDDTSPDGNTTYNESEVSTTKDLYNMAAIGYSPLTIDAATVKALVNNPDSGVTQCRLKCKSGTTEGTGSSQQPITGYTYLTELFLLNPDTTLAWTESEINAMQAGIEIV